MSDFLKTEDTNILMKQNVEKILTLIKENDSILQE